MAFRLDLQLTGVEDLLKLKAFTDPKLYEKALQGGLKYAASSVPPAAAKAIRQEYTIPSARVKQDIKGPFIRGDEATLIFSRKPPTLVQFGFNPGKRGGPQPGLGQGKGWGKPKPKGKAKPKTKAKPKATKKPTARKPAQKPARKPSRAPAKKPGK